MRAADRRKQRQRYIRRKAVALSKQFCGHLLFCTAIITMLACTFIAILAFFACGISVVLPCSALVLACGLASLGLDRFIDSAEREEVAVEYVPAFHADQLGPEEVLLRMAQDFGTRQSSEMVRPANYARTSEDNMLCTIKIGRADDADG